MQVAVGVSLAPASVLARVVMIRQDLPMDEEELPPEFSDLLGQLVYLAGRTDNLLGALTPAKADLPEGNRGLGGERLVKALQPLATPGSALEAILGAYPAMYELRNTLIHGSMNFAGGMLSVWHVPIGGKGNVAFNEMLTLEHLRGFVQSWINLRDAAHKLVHETS